jgi:2-C-methyl-D-erythritol 4-phosphate cytidylyltransferase
MSITAIVLAAGRGERLGAGVSKPLVALAGKPVLWYSLNVFARHRAITGIIVVANKDNLPGIERVIRTYRIPKVLHVILGGRRRQDSVRRGLEAVGAQSELVVIHDSGRPFIKAGLLSAAIQAAKVCGAAIAGVPVKATIKEVGRARSGVRRYVRKTFDRRTLIEAQTPQVFRRELICRAYQKYWRRDSTDDASMVERLGSPVAVVTGSYSNIKITTPEDLIVARALVEKR